MAITTGQTNFVSRVERIGEIFRNEFGELVTLDALWLDAETGYNASLDSSTLHEIPAFQHIEQSDLVEVLYIINVLKGLIAGRWEQIAVVTENKI